MAAAGPAVTLGAAGVAHADVGATPHFYLPGDGDILVRRATLHQPNWAMQSFAFDNVNGHIYFVQDKSGQAAGNKGDLWITKTDLSGNILGAMALWNFGHGSSMGVEPVGSGSTPYLWLEGASSAEGAGQRLARFRFVDGLTLDYTNPVITIYDRTPTINSYAKLPRPAIDPYKNRLLIRYATQEPADRVWRIAVFSMADAAAGRLGQDNRLAERAIPNNKELGLSDLDLFQGIALCGQYVYLSYGDAGRGSYLVILDLNQTGVRTRRCTSTTWRTLSPAVTCRAPRSGCPRVSRDWPAASRRRRALRTPSTPPSSTRASSSAPGRPDPPASERPSVRSEARHGRPDRS